MRGSSPREEILQDMMFSILLKLQKWYCVNHYEKSWFFFHGKSYRVIVLDINSLAPWHKLSRFFSLKKIENGCILLHISLKFVLKVPIKSQLWPGLRLVTEQVTSCHWRMWGLSGLMSHGYFFCLHYDYQSELCTTILRCDHLNSGSCRMLSNSHDLMCSGIWYWIW